MVDGWWKGAVCSLDKKQHRAALAQQEILTKPPGSLGKLEQLPPLLASMQRREKPQIGHPWITIFAADHGVAQQGVSAFPQAVTAEMVRNFSAGGAAIAVLAHHLGATLEVVNVGTVSEVEPLQGVIDRRIAAGTEDFTQAEAMVREQLEQALTLGREAVTRAQTAGADLYIGGEMGIANTTSAAAVAAALLGAGGAVVAGAGTGLDLAGVERKAAVIQQGLDRHAGELGDPLSILQRLGGFEIAALVGSYIAAAQQGLPLLIDGFITSVAALAAARIAPEVRNWMLFSHRSAEQGHGAVLRALDAEPLLDLEMRLGEGSGAAVAVPLLQQACWLHAEMATFTGAGISRG